MNRKLLPLLIAGLTAASANVALAGAPTVYGKINLTLNKYDLEKLSTTAFTGPNGTSYTNNDAWKMESNASRLGVKGDYVIVDGGTFKAIYKLEIEVIPSADKEGDGTSPFKQRNTYAGLQDTWGTVIFGRNDTPVKLIRTEIEAYHDMPIADVSNVLVGENRLNNFVMYTSPTIAGFAGTVGFAPGEQSGKPTTASPVSTPANQNEPAIAAYKHSKDDNGLFDSATAAVTWTAKDAFVGLAYENNIANANTVELSGQYSFGPVKLGAVLQKSEENIKGDGIQGSSIKGDTWSDHLASTANTGLDRLSKQSGGLVNVQWSVTQEVVLKAQYARSTNEHIVNATESKLSDTKLTQIAFGADYNLNKYSKVFAYYAQVKGEGELVSIASPDDTKDKTFAVGYELKF